MIPNWKTFSEYSNVVQSKGISLNIVPLLGYRTIRLSVMGYDNREPTEKESLTGSPAVKIPASCL